MIRVVLRGARGFTLIELMVVMVILGGLVALVGPNVWGHGKRARRTTAQVQIRTFADALRHFALDRREVPRTLAELTEPDRATGEPYVRSIPLDPWKQAYAYRPIDSAAAEYEISSAGPDQSLGTEDDIVYSSSTDGFREDETGGSSR